PPSTLHTLALHDALPICGHPRLVKDDPWATPGVALARVRHVLREGMRQALGDARYGPVLVALALGDQASVATQDWQVFNRTGITDRKSTRLNSSHVKISY